MGVKFTAKAQQALNKALYVAREMGHTYIGTEHLLLGLLYQSECVAVGVLEGAGIDLESMKMLVRKTAGVGEPTEIAPGDMTPGLKKVIEESAIRSRQGRGGYIGTEHLLYGILCDADCFAYKMISAKGASITSLKSDLSVFVDPERKGDAKGKKQEVPGAPMLSKYGRNLITSASGGKLDPVIGREAETERVMQILTRRTKNNPCLVGEAGVGKTAVVEGLALKIARGEVTDGLVDKIIVALDISAMIAGAKYRGEFEERMKAVMEEASANKNLILFIDEIHTIIGAGAAEGAVDAANILKPALARGDIRIIGATTFDEYRRHIEKDAALERRFQKVSVPEPSEEQTARILRGLRDKYETHHRLAISDDAIKAAVSLSVRYMRDRFLPDKAIDLIDEAASRKRISLNSVASEAVIIENKLKNIASLKKDAILEFDYEKAEKMREAEKKLTYEYCKLKPMESEMDISRRDTVTAEDVEKVVAAAVGIPIERLTLGEEEKLKDLEGALSSEIIGQDEAVRAVARAVRRGRAGMKDPERPTATFLFLGPTGVGKTGLAKSLAKVLFGNEKQVIRLDMSEYSEKHTVSKMLGSPPGYVGYDNGSYLLESVRKNPYSIVVFDEAEKAHPDVLNVLLQLLDEGRLMDSNGKSCDFRNTVVILTSNVGGERIVRKGEVGFSADLDEKSEFYDMKKDVEKELERTFSPEFINRIDEVVVFRQLNQSDVERIAEKFLAEISQRLKGEGITLEFSPDVKRHLAKNGFDGTYGARALRRRVLETVEDTLADAILEGQIGKGSNVLCTVDEKGKVCCKERHTAPM